jgi:hypothetical protein
MARPVRKLSNMEIDEVSLVDKGANQHAMITIAKRAPEEETMPELYNEDGHLLDEEDLQDGQIVFDVEGQAYQFSLDNEDADERELAEVGKAFGSNALHNLKQGFSTANAGNKMSTVAGKAGQLGRKAKNNPGKTAAGVATVGVAGGGAYGAKKQFGKSFSDTVLEELSKAYSDEDRDAVISKALGRVEELEAAQNQMAEIAKSERDLRLTREYISKAAEYNLPVDPAELGPVLYRMAETMDYDDCAVIAKCLEGAGAMIFEEQGYIGGGDNVDIMSQVEAQAVEIGKSANPETIAAVFDQAPEAYNEYLASQRGRY